MSKWIDDLQKNINNFIDNGPLKDIEESIKTFTESSIEKLDLVTKEEFKCHTEILNSNQKKLEDIMARISELESKINSLEK